MVRVLDSSETLSRRRFCRQLVGGTVAAAMISSHSKASENGAKRDFALNYILASPMYGMSPLPEVIREASKIGAESIDIWPKPHANHREQMDELGADRVAEVLNQNGVRLGAVTRYDLKTSQLQDEIPILQRFGGKLLVTGTDQAKGADVKDQIRDFMKVLRPQVAAAEQHNIRIGIENHTDSLLESPDAIRYFCDAVESPCLGLAMAPYHLPQDTALIADLIAHLGDKLVFFQAWQHGKGCQEKLPKEEEMLQMPGRGSLDFVPVLAALKKINYVGWTEIFMHPVPRGIPIRETVAQVTEEINHSRSYLDRCVQELNHR